MPQAALAYDSISFILLDYNYGTALASTSVHGLTGALDFLSCGDRTIGCYKSVSVVHFGNHVEHTILSHSRWISLDRYKVIKNDDSRTLPIQVTESSLPAASIHKIDILQTLYSAGENCTDTIITFTLVDPDIMLEIVETHTPSCKLSRKPYHSSAEWVVNLYFLPEFRGIFHGTDRMHHGGWFRSRWTNWVFYTNPDTHIKKSHSSMGSWMWCGWYRLRCLWNWCPLGLVE